MVVVANRNSTSRKIQCDKDYDEKAGIVFVAVEKEECDAVNNSNHICLKHIENL